eukprot:TRINITY_DN2256_c0_g1_i1.p1 TRINITY_DN2256_c0_g1~~TRINITY_DN2256_c0_g1_i1.p1  ORF type:complete len:207 (-),score=38.24 TRINITY_DN2256_c0_g1_i1:189-809(-)
MASESSTSASLLCRIRTLHGYQCSVDVQTTWRIKDLRVRVRQKLGIPEYEQGYLQGSIRMRSGDLLFPQSGESPELVLVRSSIPSCFSKAEALNLWSSFLAISDDHGDIVQIRRARQLARFEGLAEAAQAIAAQNDLPERLSFLELLRFFSTLKSQQPRTPTRQEQIFQNTLLLDIGNATCPRWQSDGSESETDEDESAEEDLDLD